jgi:hypothetical protein
VPYTVLIWVYISIKVMEVELVKIEVVIITNNFRHSKL